MKSIRSKALSLLVTSVLMPLLAAGCCKRTPHDGDGGSTNCGTLCAVPGDPVASPTSLDFGNVPIGATSPALKLTLHNEGAGLLNITSTTITGANVGDFHMGTKFPAQMQPGASSIVAVTFTPAAAGARAASITIETDGTPGTVTVPLTGTGVDVQICTNPSTIDFGNTQVNGTPKLQMVNVSNCGLSPVSLTFPGIEGPQATDFGEAGQMNTTLQPGASLNITVSYSPAVMGPSTADLPYGVCTGCPTQSINLTGVGVDGVLSFSPNPVNFGSPPAGSIPTAQVLGTNVGTEPLTVSSLGTYSSSMNVFSLSNPTVAGAAVTFPITLAPLAAFSFTVTYTTDGNPMGDSDTIVGNYSVADPLVAIRQALDPVGGNVAFGPCSLNVAPSSVNFGYVAAAAVGTRQVTLSNVGGTQCNVSSIALSASSDPYFALGAAQATSLTVAPGSSQQITVTFSPAVSQSPFLRTGQLTFQTGDMTNPSATVPLTATITGKSVYATGWPKWHLDNFNSGQSSADTSGDQGTVEWQYLIGKPGGGFGFGGTYINSPVISTVTGVTPVPLGGYVIYQMGMAGMVRAFAGGTVAQGGGTELWTQQLSSPSGDPHPSTGAVLADGSMFFASGSDGSSPFLYYLTNIGAVSYSLPASAPFEDGFDSAPALGQDGTLFLADDDGASPSASCGGAGGGDPSSAVAFSASAGNVTQIGGLALPLTAESERFGVVVGSDDTSYWGNNGQFFAVTPPAMGFTLVSTWPACGVTLANQSVSAISDLALDNVTNNNLYAYSAWNNGTSVQGNVAALDPATGAQKWIYNMAAANVSGAIAGLPSAAGNAAPAVALDGTVYVGNGDGLHAIDGATGLRKWLFSSADVTSSPAIGADGTIFFGCGDGNFYAVHPDGTLRFKYTTGGPISSSPAIAPDGVVVFISDDGNLYAIN